MKDKIPGGIFTVGVPLLVGVFPLISLFFCILFALGGSPEPGNAATQADPSNNADSVGFFRILSLGIVLLLILAKGAALIGNFRRWYYAWLFHSLELHLIIFILGLLAVVATLNQPFSILGFIKIISIFSCLLINFHIKNYWLSGNTRSLYRVSHYTHA